MKALLEVKHLIKDYNKETRALNDLSLTVNEGEFVVVIGPSGAGKSTFLRTINQLIPLSEGSIYFSGERIDEFRGAKLKEIRTKIGMIFQDYHLIGRTNVIKNVLHGRLGQMSTIDTIFGRFTEADKAEAIALLESVGLKDQLYKRVDELSGGQKQRVGICHALIQRPKLLLADEPIASLDPVSATTVMDYLYQITKEKHLTCLVNLHQVDFARRYADRIVGIRNGKVVFDGLPTELSDERVEKIYKGQLEEAFSKELMTGR